MIFNPKIWIVYNIHFDTEKHRIDDVAESLSWQYLLNRLWSLQVDVSVSELDRRVPPVVKQVSAQAISAAQIAPILARALATEVRRAGVVETASGVAKPVYTKYEPAAKEL